MNGFLKKGGGLLSIPVSKTLVLTLSTFVHHETRRTNTCSDGSIGGREMVPLLMYTAASVCIVAGGRGGKKVGDGLLIVVVLIMVKVLDRKSPPPSY